jgi:hypothetical protein
LGSKSVKSSIEFWGVLVHEKTLPFPGPVAW